ncbi:rRNA maturation RNase YbeY [Methylonatrum kenyense]|uniref:rRNA maturation RNase YbeY n=1 Tax=Methylonatrum kenyense TaxID=455253 RepID=UPI0020BF5FB4|nr:rRNA maturation RNase YbeY [Methylonatrum kenyense]MCK8516234.1 rRNA maturation RNase YbeY [Methylonatrum kenyense]
MSQDSRTSAAERIEIQYACRQPDCPTEQQIHAWLTPVLDLAPADASLCVRLVDSEESRSLNRRYRGRDAPTNVLSFPFESPPGLSLPILGDLVVCAEVLAGECAEQAKTRDAHWAHILTHGVLHLLGHDHQNEREATAMEGIERDLLARLGFADPYLEDAAARLA